MKAAFNIYLIGVGGQGIGLLSETILRAVDHAGFPVLGVDTHGLAQRGGRVESHVRLGAAVYTPLVSKNQADLVVALERHEALRGLLDYGRDGGRVIYYDAVWQPLSERLRKESLLAATAIGDYCRKHSILEVKVFDERLANPKMQNMAVLAAISKRELIEGVSRAHYEAALSDLLQGKVLEENLELLQRNS